MKSIKKIIIDKRCNFICNLNQPIYDIINRLNIIDEKFILIIDDNNVLVGTVTDGDLRRSMLNEKVTVKDKIKKIMNSNPLSGQLNDFEKNIEKLNSLDLQNPFLPIVDNRNMLVEVIISNKKNFFVNTALLLAGGKGTRLGNLTIKTPKPLLNINGESILKKILIKLEKEGFQNIYISVYYLSSKFESFIEKFSTNMNLNLIKEPFPLGTAGSLGLLPKELDDNILVMNSDVLTNVNFQNLISLHKKNNNDITIAAALNKTKIDFGVIEYNKNYEFERINEKPSIENFINAGLYCLSKPVINLVNKNQKIDMPKLIELSKSAGQKIGIFPMHEDWIDIGRPEDFYKVTDKEDLNEKNKISDN